MFFKKKEQPVDSKAIVTSLLSFLLNDYKLVRPVYLPEIHEESDGEKLGIAPVIYVWNENRALNTFSVSVNGNAVAHLLEGAIPRTHSMFNVIRDEAMSALLVASRESVIAACQHANAYPSDLYS